jgi:hypothetical protein
MFFLPELEVKSHIRTNREHKIRGGKLQFSDVVIQISKFQIVETRGAKGGLTIQGGHSDGALYSKIYDKLQKR